MFERKVVVQTDDAGIASKYPDGTTQSMKCEDGGRLTGSVEGKDVDLQALFTAGTE